MSNNIVYDQLYPVYPKQLKPVGSCSVNQIYQTLPEGIPFSTHVAAPANVKHIYGIPKENICTDDPRIQETIDNHSFKTVNPPILERVPINTMYGYDFSLYHDSGVGKGKRITYTHNFYPFTKRIVRERKDYANYMLPYMNTEPWLKYPVIHDATVNQYDELPNPQYSW